MNNCMCSSYKNNIFIVFLLCLVFSACKTSKEIARDRNTFKDPTGVKTLGDGSPDNPVENDLRRELDVTRGELENLRYQHQKDVEALNNQIKNLEAEKEKLIAELQNSSSHSPTQVTGVVTEDNVSESESMSRLWNLAMSDLKQQKYSESLNLFKDYAKLYPKSLRTPYAILASGLIQYKQGRYKEAALAFNEVIDLNSKKNFSALAWLGQGCSFAMLKQNEDARLFLNEAKTKFPRSPEAKLADQIIKKQRRVPLDLLSAFPSWAGPYKGS